MDSGFTLSSPLTSYLFLSSVTAHMFARSLDLLRGRGIHKYFPCSLTTCSEVVVLGRELVVVFGQCI